MEARVGLRNFASQSFFDPFSYRHEILEVDEGVEREVFKNFFRNSLTFISFSWIRKAFGHGEVGRDSLLGNFFERAANFLDVIIGLFF